MSLDTTELITYTSDFVSCIILVALIACDVFVSVFVFSFAIVLVSVAIIVTFAFPIPPTVIVACFPVGAPPRTTELPAPSKSYTTPDESRERCQSESSYASNTSSVPAVIVITSDDVVPVNFLLTLYVVSTPEPKSNVAITSCGAFHIAIFWFVSLKTASPPTNTTSACPSPACDIIDFTFVENG